MLKGARHLEKLENASNMKSDQPRLLFENSENRDRDMVAVEP